MKCPNCDAELQAAVRDGIGVEACPACQGQWLTPQELNDLEDEAFKLGDDEKGTLVFNSESTTRKCLVCGEPLRTFEYRLYDLDLDYCEAGHGFWLDAGEDKRVLDLMKEEQARVRRSGHAEDRWKAHLRHLRSGDIFQRVRELLR